jgi:hypothetical protein
MVADPPCHIERRLTGEQCRRPGALRAPERTRIPRQRDDEGRSERRRVDRAQDGSLERRPQAAARIGECDVRQERRTERAPGEAERGEGGNREVAPVAEEPGDRISDHERPDRVPRSAVEGDDPRTEEGQADHCVEEVVLGDTVVDAHPLAAQRVGERRQAEEDQRPPAPCHRPRPSKSASSAPAVSSAFEMNPHAPLRSMRPP